MRRCVWIVLLVAPLLAAPATLTVQVDQPGIKVSPLLYGIFFEEINRAGDGGIYAEMVQNRSFEDAACPLGWSVVKTGGADGSLALDRSLPLNAKNPTSLKLSVTKAGGRVGLANEGFKGAPYPLGATEPPKNFVEAAAKAVNGLAVEHGKEYRLSLYARAGDGFAGDLVASLESADGKPLATQTIAGVGAAWRKFDCRLTANATDPNARLVVSASSVGSVWLDMVSLFPRDTYKGRENGCRPDLVKMLLDLKPAFVRFPGGCFVEGHELKHASRWKESIGDIAQRPGHWNIWRYYSNDGLGYHEYLQLCEDLGAEPLFVINVGMAHRDHIDEKDLGPWVQDALDAVEYANGPVDSKWGALRAAAGHPAPFGLKYLEIGNENGGPVYQANYRVFYDALQARYPQLHLVANQVTTQRPTQINDEHYYNSPQFFMAQAGRYDKYDRTKHKVYVGEFAVTRGAGRGNLIAALGEAAFMTGMERNADVVTLCSYAPLFERDGWRTWNPNAIQFDACRTYGTPSYHAFALFAEHRADTILPCETQCGTVEAEAVGGLVGLGTWNTQAEFKDVKVVDAGGQVLLDSPFAKDTKGWRLVGDWQQREGVLACNDKTTDARALAGKPTWSNYTLTLKARKTGGAEGFLIMFRARNEKEKSWWNVGGWGNKQHGLEVPGLSAERVEGSIETGRWYDLKVELKGSSVCCWLDGKLTHEVQQGALPDVYAEAGRQDASGETIIKVVNAGAEVADAKVKLTGGTAQRWSGRATMLTGDGPNDENTYEEPRRVAAKELPVEFTGSTLAYAFPPYSVTVLRLKPKA